MTRIALARTRVSGTVTLQGTLFTFTASSSGTASAVKVREAKKLAVIASNTAARTAARVSIEKILSENSAVLSDLEITEAITNNLSTTVRIFKPLALALIASSTDGINFTLNKKTTIPADRVLTIPRGISLRTDHELIINGFLQIGESTSSESTTSSKGSSTALVTYTSNATNSADLGTVQVNKGCSSTIDAGVTFTNSGVLSSFQNYGTFTINGTFVNSGQSSQLINYDVGSIFNFGIIRNSGLASQISNSGKFTNYLQIENSDQITNKAGAIFINDTTGVITNSGSASQFESSRNAKYINNGSCGPPGTCPR